jgi:hypothetical protein
LRASSDNVEVKLAKTTEGIPEGWYQATAEEAEAHSELILAKMGKWWICQLVGGWINGPGYGGNVEAKGHRDLGHRVLLKRIRQHRATSDQGSDTAGETEAAMGQPVGVLLVNGEPDQDGCGANHQVCRHLQGCQQKSQPDFNG